MSDAIQIQRVKDLSGAFERSSSIIDTARRMIEQAATENINSDSDSDSDSDIDSKSKSKINHAIAIFSNGVMKKCYEIKGCASKYNSLEIRPCKYGKGVFVKAGMHIPKKTEIGRYCGFVLPFVMAVDNRLRYYVTSNRVVRLNYPGDDRNKIMSATNKHVLDAYKLHWKYMEPCVDGEGVQDCLMPFINDGKFLGFNSSYTKLRVRKYSKVNAAIDDKTLKLYASRDLCANEEVFINYGRAYWLNAMKERQPFSKRNIRAKPRRCKRRRGLAYTFSVNMLRVNFVIHPICLCRFKQNVQK